jgi:MFS family permease
VRRLLLLVGAIVLVDTMFYAAIAPLLPYYAHRLDLSKASAGVLAAAYPAGTLAGALPGGWLAARVGVRPTVLLGLALLAASSLAFGFAGDVAILDGARFVQGVGGAATWAGGLAWLVRRAPAARRGEVIGSAFAAALGGALLGPVLGALARETGPEPVFGSVAALGILLAAVALREPAPAAEHGVGPVRQQLRAMVDPHIAAGAALIVLVGLFFGVVDVLGPLRLDRLGAGGAAVGAVFLVSAAALGLASPLFGRWFDRAGPVPLVRLGLAGGVVLGAAIPWPAAAWLLAVLLVLSGPVVGALWVPGMGAISSGAEARGMDQAYAFAIVNLVWAAAQVAGSAAGSGVAQATSDAVPYLAVAAACGLALAFSARGGRIGATAALLPAWTRSRTSPRRSEGS